LHTDRETKRIASAGLIKKYTNQNARVVAFNVDLFFNNATDGLMYLRIADIPESTMKPVIEEFQIKLGRKLSRKKIKFIIDIKIKKSH
jgi:hypothetical protein